MSKPCETWTLAEYRAYTASGGKVRPQQPVKSLGVLTPIPPQRSTLAIQFENHWENVNGPEYIREHRVCPERKWRLDYFWTCGVFLEIQGGIYLGIKGGHTGARQFKNDCDKWNQCTVNGWRGFKLASGQITPENVVMLKEFIMKQSI